MTRYDLPADSPIREVSATGGIAGVTPYLLPRDYNTSSASVVPRETAAPITPGINGAGAIPTASKPRLATSSPLADPSYLSSGEGSSRQGLMTPAPSETSSASDSGNRSQPQNQHRGSSAPSGVGDATDESNSADRKRVRSPKGSLAAPSALTHSIEPPRHRVPNVHADSGLRFPTGQMPAAVADELLSQEPTEFPPAYTPS